MRLCRAGVVRGGLALVVTTALATLVPPVGGAATQESGGRSITIYKAECPPGYAGDASADECDDNPIAGVPFRVGRPFTDAFYEYVPTNAEGLVAFEIGGLPLDGTLRVIEELPAGTERFVAYCIDGAGDPLGIVYPEDVGNPALGVADVAVGDAGDVACDWYNVPGAATADHVPPASASVEGRPIAVHSGTCGNLNARPRFELNPLVATRGDDEGSQAATPADASFTTLDASISDLLADDHAIAVGPSGETRRPGNAAPLVACGEIGGARAEAGSLAVGLREQNGSGVAGIAYLVPDPTAPGRTRVSVFTADRLAEED